MLSRLAISNLATIQSLAIEFEHGFTVLTGETGAGKSILVDAIRFVLGAKASPHQIRGGAQQTTVEAVFDLAELAEAREILAELEIPAREELILRRTLHPNGRSRAMANDCGITQQKLEKLGENLVNIHGQHDNQQLLDPDSHAFYLDAFAELEELRQSVGECYREYTRLLREKKNLEEHAARRQLRRQELDEQIEELRGAALKVEEEEELGQQHTRLTNIETLAHLTGTVGENLYEGDGAILARLSAQESLLARAALIDGELRPLADQLGPLTLQLEDIYQTLNGYFSRLEADPNGLELINERLAGIEKIKRRHGGSVTAALDKLKAMEEELEELTLSDEQSEELAGRIEEVAGRLHELGNRLSGERRGAVEKLEGLINEQLHQLGMTKALFRAEIKPLLGKDGKTPLYTAQGKESVEYLLTANPGQKPRPLARIASGGELSRIMLALKTVLARGDPTRTLVFDEVDAGISGAVAEIAGKKLRALGESHQVLCVTHLPQIAAMGTHHLLVSKETMESQTFTRASHLEHQEKIREVARLLSGIDMSSHSLASAEEMVNRGRQGVGSNLGSPRTAAAGE